MLENKIKEKFIINNCSYVFQRIIQVIVIVLIVFQSDIVLSSNNHPLRILKGNSLFNTIKQICLKSNNCLASVAFKTAQTNKAWNNIKGKHFIVYYFLNEDRSFAQAALRRAEEYYRKIGTKIGYTRYYNFWTWDERVKIIIFPDQESFIKKTGQPAWSTGYADRDSYLFKSRTIVTYKQESDFFNGLLPHEIGHLILHDFIPSGDIPIWFDEGVAQLYEESKSAVANKIMKSLVKKNNYIYFDVFMDWDIRKESDPKKVKVFYSQSISVVEFLIKKYGSFSFGTLCRNLRDGKSFEDALKSTYTNNIESVDDLERKWLSYMKY